MKKFIFLISMLFVTVCYAVPPPDVGIQPVDETVLVAAEDAFSLDQFINVQETGIEVQEVTFAYIGYQLAAASEADVNEGYEFKPGERLANLYLLTTNVVTCDESPPMMLTFLRDKQDNNNKLQSETNSCFGNCQYPLICI